MSDNIINFNALVQAAKRERKATMQQKAIRNTALFTTLVWLGMGIGIISLAIVLLIIATLNYLLGYPL